MPDTLQGALAQALETHAGSPLLEVPGGATLTYGDVAGGAARFAGALAEAGVKPGDRVLVQVDKSPSALMLYLACVRAGAIYLPLNSDYTEAELAYFLSDAEPSLAVCDPRAEALFTRLVAPSCAPRTLAPSCALRTLAADGTGTLRAAATGAGAPRGPDDVAAILYTSGTTGRPKGAMLTHRNLLSNATTLIGLWRFSARDALIHALPLFHVHGLFIAGHCALLSGAKMIFLSRFDAEAVVAALPRASVLMGVPTHYTRLLAHPGFTREAAAPMRLFISGSAPLTEDTFKAFEACTGTRILERYGMTETGMLTSNPYDGPRVAGSVGPALPGVSVRVVDRETGRALAAGDVGLVEVKGPNVFAGYWRNAEKTAAAFTGDGYFRTGDLGVVGADGAVNLVGRGTDLIISGGLNVYPKEIEAALDDLPEVAESAVIGLPHPDFGEAVVAVVVPAVSALDENTVRAKLKTVLAGFKIPKRVIVVDELPRNAMGKVQKAALRKAYAALFQAV